jgi:hypothetical protein
MLIVGREVPAPDVVKRSDDSDCHRREAELMQEIEW